MGFWVVLTNFASLVLGLLYPAFASVLALETSSGEDDSQWLTYWLIYSLFAIFEKLAWPVLQWIPLYTQLKVLMLAWLALPQTKGAAWVFEELLAPGLAWLRKEATKAPALEPYVKTYAPGPATTSPSASTADQQAKLRSSIADVQARLEKQLEAVSSTSDPAAKKRASKAFDKDLRRISGIGASAPVFAGAGKIQ